MDTLRLIGAFLLMALAVVVQAIIAILAMALVAVCIYFLFIVLGLA